MPKSKWDVYAATTAGDFFIFQGTFAFILRNGQLRIVLIDIFNRRGHRTRSGS